MSNKFEKHSGFEHVNIKTSQTPVKSKQAYYVSVYYSFSQESPLYMFESEEAAVKFIREQYNEEWQITMKEREEHNIPVEADELLRQISDDGRFARIEQVDYNNPRFMEWNVTTVWNEPKTEGDPKTNGIASKDKGEQNGRI